MNAITSFVGTLFDSAIGIFVFLLTIIGVLTCFLVFPPAALGWIFATCILLCFMHGRPMAALLLIASFIIAINLGS